MQTDTTERISIFTHDFPPALPPAPSQQATDVIRKSFRIGILLRAICLLTSMSVITISAIQKAQEILDAGVINYISREILKLSEDTLGANVGEIAIGEAIGFVPSTEESPSPELPSVHYIPLEEIKNELLVEEKLQRELLDSLYFADIGNIPEGTYPIIPTDSSASSPLKLKNETSFNVDMTEISQKAAAFAGTEITKEPLVLIVHTHGTEGFANELPYYNEKTNHPRTDDVSKNVVAVGKVLCETLNKNGIPTMHCETMHDKDSYIKAYDKSAESIKHYLEKYPSIQYVFDVHRDSLIRSDMTKLKPVTLFKKEPCAQIMMIIGSSEKGAPDYNWEDNLVFATAIQNMLFDSADGVARPLYLRGATYNQQYAKHGLLVEIGSCGNTLDEAKTAAKVFGNAAAAVIKSED